ncbi:Protein of unknown function [Bacillus cereus]|uniref:Uncharacterized protein n=2 Tax=Bacillus cereus group TaxID=86661 RepID=A0A1C4G8F6_9BACI|nr:Protein of unknown function [Bacillus wiedmannii]SCC63320.1 Protein of unknown function [Bacillus thuringiensis]SCC64414.1 Protein of unknown function [Bacillus cereus]SCC62704.1 Protein of unknown function [Bacillus wiedmannii]SCM09003.1 Protein of unknown function [Bacillus wiedmannii]
MIQATMNFL